MLQNVEALGLIYLGMLVLVPVMFAAKYCNYHSHWPDRNRWFFFIKLAMALEVIGGAVGWIIGRHSK